MASHPEQAAAVINTLLSRVAIEAVSGGSTSYEELYDYEPAPGEFSAIPVSTLRYFGPTEIDAYTGGLTSNEWRFLQMTWLDNSDPEAAQREWMRFSESIESAIRHATPDDLTLEDGTPVEITYEQGGAPLEGTTEERSFYAPVLYITARTEES